MDFAGGRGLEADRAWVSSQRTRHLEIDPFEDPELQPARVSGKRRPEISGTHNRGRCDRKINAVNIPRRYRKEATTDGNVW
ncbi:MAG: hypothetical protein M0C28_11200 [Candidatus Moduliflexus flocculans]|nr:hypothetical protein [Candidatus Moduliflexus flocculans]